MRRSRLKLTLLAAPLALALGAPVHADQVVYFSNGKAIMVKSVEKGEKFTVLEMDGGGRIGVPTDQIARIEEYALSAPSAPQAAPPPAPAPVAAQVPAPQPAVSASGGLIGIPANLPPAAPMTPGPGVGGRPTTAPGKGISSLRPLDISGGAAPVPGWQRPVPQANAGPAVGGPGGGYRGRGAARPNFDAGRRFAGRPGMAGRGVRPPEANRYVPPPSPPAVQSQPPVPSPPPEQNPPPPAEDDPSTKPDPETEPAQPTDPDNETSDPEPPAPEEGETPDDSSGGES